MLEELETKDKLLHATVKLLTKTARPEKITARQIAEVAEVNLAMINYCFKSKDQLIDQAVSQILAPYIARYSDLANGQGEPKERLFQLLNYFCELSLKFAPFLSLTVPYKLLQKEFAVPNEMINLISEFYEQRIPPQFSRVIALQLVSFSELLLYRGADFKEFSGIDLTNQRQREYYLRFQIELFLQAKIED